MSFLQPVQEDPDDRSAREALGVRRQDVQQASAADADLEDERRERISAALCVERGFGTPSCTQVLYLFGALGALEDRRFWARAGQEGETAPGLHGAGSDVTFGVVQKIFQKQGHP